MAKAELQTIELPATALITPPEMLNQAITSGANIDVMERLMAMNERWEAVQARKAFDTAMSELRSNMPRVLKTQTVDFTTQKGRTHYKYEDLAAVTDALSPIMADLGLSFRWRTDSKSGVTVTCIISHKEGHSEENSLSAGADGSGGKNAIQAIGSAVTYLQRYTLKAAVGIAAAHDDDARSVSNNEQPKNSPQTKPQPSKANSREEYEQIVETIRGAANESDLRDYWKTKPWAGMPKDWIGEISEEKDAKLASFNAAKSQSPQDSLDGTFPGDLQTEAAE